MATFQMEMRQQQQQQQQQQQPTNLKQRLIATRRHQNPRQHQQQQQKQQQQRLHLESPPKATESTADAIRLTDCPRLWPSTTSSSSRATATATTSTSSTSHTNNSRYKRFFSCSCRRRALIMLSMLVVIVAVISGNGVLAAQRDSYKSKDMTSSNNAIPNASDVASSATATSTAAAAAGAPNGVGSGSGSSNSNNSNGNSKNAQATSSLPSSSAAAAGSSTGGTGSMTTDASSSGSTSTITGIASGSLHKATGNSNTIASPAGAAAASGIHRNSIELIEDARNAGPYFDKASSKNVTALLGKTAYLNCRVKNLGNKTMLLQVSWVRHRDIHLLTVGRYTYTSDQRFRAIHQPQTEDWMLQIKYPQHRDSGVYECQVSTTPHMSHYIHLNVVEPSTEIIGAPDLYIESGSTINLTCVILNSPEPPAYIFWNHNNAIINYDSPRGGVSVVTNKGDTTTSFLLIKSARPSDSGHYQCNPSNAKAKSVTVHVLNGVSHSVSRGVPSSNAARGTNASSQLGHSISLGVPVCVLLQLGMCRTLATLLGDFISSLIHHRQDNANIKTTRTRGHNQQRRQCGDATTGTECLFGKRHFLVECILRLFFWLRTQRQLQSRNTFGRIYEADIR
ncbi:uncharacterized protein LOC6647338 isoform X1 [Drosophila willistoni]|uniref:uncharacterized protein LOC6647338 isoform X1 n=1 Tax=Drosophila willistoni TaxID=7260 RepID=UPI000C26C507|nr:uncharacterized protein LOC6647338 isoform X1 [Drosophila willistoni]